jgi:hypothetical protein
MMNELIRIGDEITASLRDILSPYGRLIRGVLLDVDDYWEFSELARGFRHHFTYESVMGGHWSYYRKLFQVQSLHEHHRPEMQFRPYWWEEHCQAMGYPSKASPVIVRVILKEESRREVTELPRSFLDYPIVYEFRGANRGLSMNELYQRLSDVVGRRSEQRMRRAPSIGRATPNTAGTLGGLLTGSDPTKIYLVTCAHVLGPPGTDVYQPGPYEGKRSQSIANVKHWSIPNPGMFGDPCSGPTNPDAGRLDLAVAESAIGAEMLRGMGNLASVNSVRPITAMRKNDRVIFTGKTSGRKVAKVGALTLWDQIEFTGLSDPGDPTRKELRCFSRIFEIRSPTRQYVREDLADPGDSGSWVVFPVGDLVLWCGMVISCDGGQAYACFADYVLEECNRCGVFPGGLRILA